MFHPLDRPMQRGWVGRIVGDTVIHLAAQTLQSFFSGGGGAREHAEYPLADVAFLAPVLHPPTVRIFEAQDEFAFANTAAVAGPEAVVTTGGPLVVLPRVAGIVGDEGELGGYTGLAEWRKPGQPVPKDRDFALVLGPVVVTSDELDPSGVEAVVRTGDEEALRAAPPPFDWEEARSLAARGTELRPGDILAGPAMEHVPAANGVVVLELAGVGTLRSRASSSA
jgi:hypothetical protein